MPSTPPSLLFIFGPYSSLTTQQRSDLPEVTCPTIEPKGGTFAGRVCVTIRGNLEGCAVVGITDTCLTCSHASRTRTCTLTHADTVARTYTYTHIHAYACSYTSTHTTCACVRVQVGTIDGSEPSVDFAGPNSFRGAITLNPFHKPCSYVIV